MQKASSGSEFHKSKSGSSVMTLKLLGRETDNAWQELLLRVPYWAVFYQDDRKFEADVLSFIVLTGSKNTKAFKRSI